MPHTVVQKNYESARIQEDGLATKRFVREHRPDRAEFYEFEPAVVLDIILDDEHPLFSQKSLDKDDWPPDISGAEPEEGQYDFSWVGRIKFRFYYTQQGQAKETLHWALPLENTGVTEYPLLNEVVAVVKYLDNYYYTKKINIKSLINANADFAIERRTGLVEQNFDEYATAAETPMEGPVSTMNAFGGSNYEGVLGKYFKHNHRIRAVKRYEGDTVMESRFGSSVRFGAYDNNRENDSGEGEYSDGGGNPYVLIRNRQSPVSPDQENKGFLNKGYVTESVNNDGSSIQLTSGKTISDFFTTCKKVMFQASVLEEQAKYSPEGATSFEYPTQDGDQIVINSDRLIFSSKAKETFHFSKKRYAIVTDNEFTVDAHDQIVMTTNKKAVINSPEIYLGAYDDADEPVMLGRTSVFWMYQLCNWIINQTDLLISQAEDWHAVHVHNKDTRGDASTPPMPNWSSKMKQYASQLRDMRAQMVALRDSLPQLMSTRVFTVGGGGAPGYDGGELKE